MRQLRGFVTGQLLPIVLLTLVIAWNVYSAATSTWVVARVLGVGGVAFLAFVLGVKVTQYRLVRSVMREFAPFPEDITWHQDDDGRTHALVTTHGGELHDIVMPDDIDNAHDAMQYVVEALALESDDE